MRSESRSFGNWTLLLNSMVAPLIGDVADDAFARRAVFADLGDAAIHHLVARASRAGPALKVSQQRGRLFTPLCSPRKTG